MPMHGKILYIDCFSGVSGDMFAGAVLDLGVGSIDLLEAELYKLDLHGWSLSLERASVSGISAGRFRVNVSDGQEPRDLEDIRNLISSSGLAEKVEADCLAVFQRLAEAEAEAHGESPKSVHFHEVGMVDSIVDVVSACVLMEEFSPAQVVCSPVALGSGTVETAHGKMPVPAPATVNLLKGVPVLQGGEGRELTTPTGAALVSHFSDSFGSLPAMRIERVGYGAGTGETAGPNLLRVMAGEQTGHSAGGVVEHQMMLKTSIDDSTPEGLAHLTEKLLKCGATDAWITPVVMKKGRPGAVLSVLCRNGDVDSMLDLIFRESSTFGVRTSSVERHCLERRLETAETEYGPVRIKTGSWRGRQVTVSPEYEDCRLAAEKHGVPLKAVYEAAYRAAGKRQAKS